MNETDPASASGAINQALSAILEQADDRLPQSFDHVVITYTTVSGDDQQVDFIVDDYERREASGDIDKYLDERVKPKLRQTWHPVFTETGRLLGHKVLCDGEYVTV